MTVPFAARLDTAVASRGRLCVGIDPHPASLAAWGLENDLDGLEHFSRGLVDAVGAHVACLKPQSAFFEAHGPEGLGVLARVLGDIASTGALSILDVKRGDIGSTMVAYARAYLADDAPLAADAITVSPFLGFGTLTPALDLAEKTGRGLFVLTRTSNPEGAGVQLAHRPSREVGAVRTVAQDIVVAAAAANAAAGSALVGLVIGASLKTLDVDLVGFDGWVLAPGIGTQGGEVAHLRELFGASLHRVLPTASRAVADAGPNCSKVAARLAQSAIF